MILFIDTTDLEKAKFAFVPESGTIKSKIISIPYHENYKTLEHLEMFLNKNKINLNSIKQIIICSGPGSFTGLRVSASIAQALSFALRIPFAAVKKSQVPKNLRGLIKVKGLKKMDIDYGRPAIY